VVKLDSAGTEQWSKTLGGTGDDRLWSVAVCSDGGYILAGKTESYGANNWDGWVVKLESECPDSDGDSWDDCYELQFGTDPNAVDTDGDGIWDPQDPNPWIAGTTTSTTSTTTTTTMTTMTVTTTPSRIPAPGLLIAIMCLMIVTYITTRKKRI
jgi:hypothetical protein